ncbi:unnamed protein product [Rotaria magnacalcarata]|uniref:Uncharacterized protein n=1 Tax=Rotaria magnacalcarata TaxID=392030 RepID=A0A816YTP8_9BILA|nr:unnamed protein product [Rotaria magnacalcarata]
MIDTGATHSFITQGALSTLYHSAIPSCNRIAQLGDGQTTLKIIGEIQLLLQFDKVFTHLNVLVVKTMNTDFILDVKSINVIHIPPRKSYTVQAKVELSSADTVYFSPIDVTQSKKSIVMSPSLLHINNYTTYLEVYNPHDYTCTLPMNTLLCRTPRRSSSLSYQHPIINTIEIKSASSATSKTIDNLLAHIQNVQDKQQLRFILQQQIKNFDISKVTQANTHI